MCQRELIGEGWRCRATPWWRTFSHHRHLRMQENYPNSCNLRSLLQAHEMVLSYAYLMPQEECAMRPLCLPKSIRKGEADAFDTLGDECCSDVRLHEVLVLHWLPAIDPGGHLDMENTTNRRTVNEKRMIDKEFMTSENLITWLKYLCTIGGFWPLEKTYIRAGVWILYFTLHLVMQWLAFLTAFEDFETTVFCLVETSMQSMVYTKLIVFRYSSTIRSLIHATKEELAGQIYENYEEKLLYLKYNSLSKWYYKISVPYVMTASICYYSRPVLVSVLLNSNSENISMTLPFHVMLPFTIVDSRMYWMTYAYQSPMLYLLTCQNIWICVLISIQLHICGQLSIVEYRIRNISHIADRDASRIVFKSLVDRHTKSIWMAKSFNDSFHVILLLDLVVMTVLLGLVPYVIIVGDSSGNSTTVPVFVLAGTATLLLMYGYCVVGEALISESTKVHAAFYECIWYESSATFKNAVVIGMLSSQEPLRMTAGKFFVFSLSGFTDVLKTAMGYVSMLRKVST